MAGAVISSPPSRAKYSPQAARIGLEPAPITTMSGVTPCRSAMSWASRWVSGWA
ncbi:hypothetical protein [Phenylobacterium sp. J367]|uniref:hypothetical protein n=1 Tax=Phenylobacterium sp. J367 TaxID=2898435 RepID=UPI0021513111|nr:hypothetical protein [Phenylobacterium sp. J367]MCR5880477.1 hypothetical protein [Phenylobacterium sp. J367]